MFVADGHVDGRGLDVVVQAFSFALYAFSLLGLCCYCIVTSRPE